MLKLQDSTSTPSALRTINSAGGTIQTLALQHGRIGLDVQAKSITVEGESVVRHSFIVLSRHDTVSLRDALASALGASTEAVCTVRTAPKDPQPWLTPPPPAIVERAA